MNIKSTLQFLVTFTSLACLILPTQAADGENNITPMLSLLLFAEYKEVTSASGLVWLDRNLGASRVATSPTDLAAFGDLYQWGRLTDGHEKRSSFTFHLSSATDIPGHPDFIIYHGDWRSPSNDNLWQGVSGVNNPCPAGFRIPTKVELETEQDFWISNNAAGAFASPLKLVAAGYRDFEGTVGQEGIGIYWSNTAIVDDEYAGNLIFTLTNSWVNVSSRSTGCSVRCIKD